ncbi:MAG: serine hydrolase domain-containing protein [Pseudomonadota bacterium]
MRTRQVLSLFVLALLLSKTVTASDEATLSDAPYGLWIYARDTRVRDHVLTVAFAEGRWHAALDGRSVGIRREDSELVIDGPDGESFFGAVPVANAPILGYWKQPSDAFAYSDVVTRTVLATTSSGHWQGEVSPQPRPFVVFLDVFQNAEGRPEAVLRNPERNEIVAARFNVKSEGQNAWLLIAGRGDGERRVRLTRNGLASLELSHPFFNAPISLRPATRDESTRYLPRPRQMAPYRRSPPAQTDDGWRVIKTESAGFDGKKLDHLVNMLAAEDPRRARPRLVHSMLVAHRGRLLLEEYFYGYNRDTPHDTRSLAKVFGPIMIGALRHQGVHVDVDERTVSQVMMRAGLPLDDARKSQITLGHLMSFSSGLDCEASARSQGSEDAMWSQSAQTDFWRFTAQLPLLYEPGTRYAYCSGSINMAAASITAASGMALYETFDQYVAEPLGFGTYHWNLAPNGAGYLAGGVYLRPRDILKLGAMYAAGGVWRSERVVSTDWISDSTAARIAITPQTTRLSPEVFGDNYWGGEQAYVWRRDVVKTADQDYASFEATGNGGQVLLVVPELELAVVFTGGNYRWGSIWGRWRNELVGGHVIPALAID